MLTNISHNSWLYDIILYTTPPHRADNYGAVFESTAKNDAVSNSRPSAPRYYSYARRGCPSVGWCGRRGVNTFVCRRDWLTLCRNADALHGGEKNIFPEETRTAAVRLYNNNITYARVSGRRGTSGGHGGGEESEQKSSPSRYNNIT